MDLNYKQHTMNLPRELPNNYVAEQYFLCCLWNDESFMDQLKVRPDMLYNKDNRELMEVMLKAYEKTQTFDASMISELWWNVDYFYEILLATISRSQFDEYQSLILENYNRRILIKWLQKAINIALSDWTVDSCLQSISEIPESLVNQIQEQDFADVVNEVINELWTNNFFICSYWFPKMDELLWWYKIWQLNVIWARPWVWKTSISLSLAYEIVTQNKKCLILSLEMTAKEIASRLVSKISSVSMWSLSRIQWERINEVARSVAEKLDFISNFTVYDSVIDIDSIVSTIRRVKIKTWLDVVFIDYLWLISTTRRESSRNLEIQYMTRVLKQLAKELNICIVVLSQLNRNVEQANRQPQLSDLRDSWAIEQDADVVILLHRNFQDSPKEMEVLIAKHRNWKTDNLSMWFNQQTMSLLNDLPTN